MGAAGFGLSGWVSRRPPGGTGAPGPAAPTCTPPSTASPAWPTPRPSMDEKASTTIGFFCRARAFLAAHGITELVRVVTDSGMNYRSQPFTATITSLASHNEVWLGHRVRRVALEFVGYRARTRRLPYEREPLTAGTFGVLLDHCAGASLWLTRQSRASSSGARSRPSPCATVRIRPTRAARPAECSSAQRWQ